MPKTSKPQEESTEKKELLTTTEIGSLRAAEMQMQQLEIGIGRLELKKTEYIGQVANLTHQLNGQTAALRKKYGEDKLFNVKTGEIVTNPDYAPEKAKGPVKVQKK